MATLSSSLRPPLEAPTEHSEHLLPRRRCDRLWWLSARLFLRVFDRFCSFCRPAHSTARSGSVAFGSGMIRKRCWNGSIAGSCVSDFSDGEGLGESDGRSQPTGMKKKEALSEFRKRFALELEATAPVRAQTVRELEVESPIRTQELSLQGVRESRSCADALQVELPPLRAQRQDFRLAPAVRRRHCMHLAQKSPRAISNLGPQE